MKRIRLKLAWTMLVGSIVFAGVLTIQPTNAQEQHIGINILLKSAPTEAMLAGLGKHGKVLDILPTIHAVTMNAAETELPAIQRLPYVSEAAPDAVCKLLGGVAPLRSDLSGGASHWSLDAINVTDYGVGRTVPYTGAGVYVGIIDTGLFANWRDYFPEERVATRFARAFGGGLGEQGTVSEQPELWEHDNTGHGTFIASIILGFRYLMSALALPDTINGVAPAVTVIPVKAVGNNAGTFGTESTLARAMLYLAELKISGALGSSPLVVNVSFGHGFPMPLFRAAMDYAIANGVVVVVGAGNNGDAGMTYPAAYPECISVGATGWTSQFPTDDLTGYEWVARDFPENDLSAHFVAPFSSRALPGQELDVVAPGAFIPVPYTTGGLPDYSFAVGSSHAAPHAAGVAALLLEKNPILAQADIEALLRSTALPLAPGVTQVRFGVLEHLAAGPYPVGVRVPTVGNGFANQSLIDLIVSWGLDATGSGLIQADSALAATPAP